MLLQSCEHFNEITFANTLQELVPLRSRSSQSTHISGFVTEIKLQSSEISIEHSNMRKSVINIDGYPFPGISLSSKMHFGHISQK